MGVNTDVLSILNSIFRPFIVSFICAVCFFNLLDWMLLRQRKRTVLILYYVSKMVILNIVMGTFLNTFFQGILLWDAIYTSLVIITIVTNYLAVCYTYQDRFIKIAVAACIAEMVATYLVSFSLVIINLIEGREDVLAYMSGPHPLDIFLIPLVGGLLWIFYHYISPYIVKFKNYRLKNEKIWWTALFIYIIVTSLSMFGDKSRAMVMVTTQILCGGASTAVVAFIVKKYLRSVQTEQQYLTAQQQLLGAHYTALYDQIYQMENQQREIDRSMQEIMALEENGGDTGKVLDYLHELRQEYQGIRAGLYCDDWKLDALLFSQAEIIRKQGITFECSMQGYKSGMIEEQDFTVILLYLLNFGVQANELSEYTGKKWVRLRAAEVKNQLIIEYTGTCPVNNHIRRRRLRQSIKKYNGNLLLKKNAMDIKIVLTLEQMKKGYITL